MSTAREGCNERVRLGGEVLMFVITSAFLTFFCLVLFWSAVVLYPPATVAECSGTGIAFSSASPNVMGTEPRGFQSCATVLGTPRSSVKVF